MRGELNRKQITIECPNTIFRIFIQSEHELSKVTMFIDNLRSVEHLELNDIYQWCNRQGIAYDTKFHYHRDYSLWNNFCSYLRYSSHKMKYKIRLESV